MSVNIHHLREAIEYEKVRDPLSSKLKTLQDELIKSIKILICEENMKWNRKDKNKIANLKHELLDAIIDRYSDKNEKSSSFYKIIYDTESNTEFDITCDEPYYTLPDHEIIKKFETFPFSNHSDAYYEIEYVIRIKFSENLWNALITYDEGYALHVNSINREYELMKHVESKVLHEAYEIGKKLVIHRTNNFAESVAYELGKIETECARSLYKMRHTDEIIEIGTYSSQDED